MIRLVSNHSPEFVVHLVEEYNGWIISLFERTYELFHDESVGTGGYSTLTHPDGRVFHWCSDWMDEHHPDDTLIYQSGDIEQLRETLRKLGVAKVVEEFSPF